MAEPPKKALDTELPSYYDATGDIGPKQYYNYNSYNNGDQLLPTSQTPMYEPHFIHNTKPKQPDPPPTQLNSRRLPYGWTMYRNQEQIPYFVFSIDIYPDFIHSQWEFPTKSSISEVKLLLAQSLDANNIHNFDNWDDEFDQNDNTAHSITVSGLNLVKLARSRKKLGTPIATTTSTNSVRAILPPDKLKRGHAVDVQEPTLDCVFESAYYNMQPIPQYPTGNTPTQFLTPLGHFNAQSTCCAYSCNRVCGRNDDEAKLVKTEMCCSFWLTLTMLLSLWSMILGAILPLWDRQGGFINIILLSTGGGIWVSILVWPIVQYCPNCCYNPKAVRLQPQTERLACTRIACGKWAKKSEPLEHALTRQTFLERVDDLIIANPKLRIKFTAFNLNKPLAHDDKKQIMSPSGFVRSSDAFSGTTSSRKDLIDKSQRQVKFEITVDVPIVSFADLSPSIVSTRSALAMHPCSVIDVSFSTRFIFTQPQEAALEYVKIQLIESYREYGQFFEFEELRILEPADNFNVSLAPVQIQQLGEISHCGSRFCCWNPLVGGFFWNGLLNCFFPSYCWYRVVSTGEFNYETVKYVQLGEFDPKLLPNPADSIHTPTPYAQ